MKFSAIKPLGLKYLPGLAGALSALALAGCMGFGSTGGGVLPVGLTAPMDVPGAQLDRVQSLGLVNQYRASTGVAPLAADSGLDASAQLLATQYANTGTAPKQPGGIVAVRYSAGYQNFAETFSGWRNSAADASILANGAATRAGVAVAHNPNSAYGVYWVLILGN
jgi:uncharacterized protein YkwD